MAVAGSSPPGAASVDVSVELAGVRLTSPLVLASGVLGTDAGLMERVARAGAGAVTLKSAGPVPRPGHPNPTCVEFGAGLLNAIGLANPGARAEVALVVRTRQALAPLGVRVIASVFADSAEGFGQVAAVMAEAEPDFLELNISCPNVASEFGEPFSARAQSAAAATGAARKAVGLPLIVKLAPNVPDIAAIARAVVDAGADALCAVNTMPGMVIDPESGQPVLANKSGGVSGPALLPVALLAVYLVSAAVAVPVIGTGGVSSGADAVAMLSAGATVVGVGSAVYLGGPAAFAVIRDELAAWLASRHLSLADVRGRAHRPLSWPEPASVPPLPRVEPEE
jgi:dihydroorotate dehydrogenase (NAD+) catalytic subunit